MTVPFWKKHEPTDTSTLHEPARAVDEQHALPVGIYWTPEGAPEARGVDRASPLPVAQTGPAQVQGRLVRVGPTIIPGIPVADAEDANDQMGTASGFMVPRAGCVLEARFYDFDDEGINKTVWVFNDPPTLAANDAAFSLADSEIAKAIHVFTFSTWRDAVNGQMGVSYDVPFWYTAPSGFLYFAVQTAGADNIASSSMPALSLTIERYSED